ncbi:MAG: GIY-YIG nuclease family protein [Desulfovibrio sp.]|nr:GIY-YIG nuclease family protein [Desulfovibrio sp.]
MNTWHVYLLQCADGTYYCGVATDIRRRIDQHNGNLPGGAKYTRSRRPVKLLVSRECETKSMAYSLEHVIKSSPRAEKLGVLNSSDWRASH